MTISTKFTLAALTAMGLLITGTNAARTLWRTGQPDSTSDEFPWIWSITNLDEGADFNKFRVLVSNTDDITLTTDVLIQLTYPTSATGTASQSFMVTFPSDGTNKVPEQFAVKQVTSGKLDTTGSVVTRSGSATWVWDGITLSDTNYFTVDPVNGPGGTGYSQANYVTEGTKTSSISNGCKLEFVVARASPRNENIVLETAIWNYEPGTPPPWEPVEIPFSDAYGYDKTFVQTSFYVTAGLSFVPVISLPLLSVPMTMLIFYFIFSPIYMQYIQNATVYYDKNEYFIPALFRNIGGTSFLFLCFGLNSTLGIAPFASVIVQLSQGLIGIFDLSIEIIAAQAIAVWALQVLIGISLIGIGYGLYYNWETPLMLAPLNM